MTKNCREIVELLLDYIDGTLSAEDRAAIDAHLSDCPPCVRFVESYRETPRIVRQATNAHIPPEVAQRLRRFLDGKRRGS